MSSWKKKQPELVADAILKRAELGKVCTPYLPFPKIGNLTQTTPRLAES
jgi:hypothetical protein